MGDARCLPLPRRPAEGMQPAGWRKCPANERALPASRRQWRRTGGNQSLIPEDRPTGDGRDAPIRATASDGRTQLELRKRPISCRICIIRPCVGLMAEPVVLFRGLSLRLVAPPSGPLSALRPGPAAAGGFSGGAVQRTAPSFPGLPSPRPDFPPPPATCGVGQRNCLDCAAALIARFAEAAGRGDNSWKSGCARHCPDRWSRQWPIEWFDRFGYDTLDQTAVSTLASEIASFQTRTRSKLVGFSEPDDRFLAGNSVWPIPSATG